MDAPESSSVQPTRLVLPFFPSYTSRMFAHRPFSSQWLFSLVYDSIREGGCPFLHGLSRRTSTALNFHVQRCCPVSGMCGWRGVELELGGGCDPRRLRWIESPNLRAPHNPSAQDSHEEIEFFSSSAWTPVARRNELVEDAAPLHGGGLPLVLSSQARGWVPIRSFARSHRHRCPRSSSELREPTVRSTHLVLAQQCTDASPTRSLTVLTRSRCVRIQGSFIVGREFDHPVTRTEEYLKLLGQGTFATNPVHSKENSSGLRALRYFRSPGGSPPKLYLGALGAHVLILLAHWQMGPSCG